MIRTAALGTEQTIDAVGGPSAARRKADAAPAGAGSLQLTVGDIQRNASPHDCCSRIVPRVSALPLGHGSAGTLHAAGPPSLRGPPSRWRSVPGRVAANAVRFVTMLKHAFSSPVTGSRNYSTFSWRKRNVQCRPAASTWCGLGKSRRMPKVPPPASNTRSTMLPVPYNCRRSAPQTWRVRFFLACP